MAAAAHRKQEEGAAMNLWGFLIIAAWLAFEAFVALTAVK